MPMHRAEVRMHQAEVRMHQAEVKDRQSEARDRQSKARWKKPNKVEAKDVSNIILLGFYTKEPHNSIFQRSS